MTTFWALPPLKLLTNESSDSRTRLNVSAIFSNNTVSPRLVEAVAREVGGEIKVVRLYEGSVGEAGSEAATYAGMMRADARLIADALA